MKTMEVMMPEFNTIEDDGVSSVLDRLVTRLLKNEDLSICVLAGCEIEHIIKEQTITLRTKNPVKIVREKGKVTVYEKLKDNSIKETSYAK